MSEVHEIFYVCYTWLWLGPPLTFCTSGFVDDVMSAHNRRGKGVANRMWKINSSSILSDSPGAAKLRTVMSTIAF